MYSTDHNINNPLKTVDIELLRNVPSWDIISIISLTQEEYNLIQIHDPNTCYHIKDSKDNRIYIGDILYRDEYFNIKYLLAIDKNCKYNIYMNVLAGTSKDAELIPICTYDDPQVAINELSKFNRVGSHIKPDLDLYNLFTNYFQKNISTHDLIIGILIIFGYKEDPRLQNVIQFIVANESHKCMKSLMPFCSEQLNRMRDFYPESLYPLYSDLYDLVVKYNFFTDRKYQEDGVNLSKEINDVWKVRINL